MQRLLSLALIFLGLSAVSPLWAQLTVGLSLSLTGPAAALGEAQRNTVALLPSTLHGQRVEYLVRDDASDVLEAMANMRYFTEEKKVDLVIGSTTSPNSLAMVEQAFLTHTPLISLAAARRIVDPVTPQKRWVFKTPQNDAQMALAIVAHMARQGVQNVAFIGFSDAYGEGWLEQFRGMAQTRKIRLVGTERFHRTDTHVDTAVARMLQNTPEAILIAASGHPALIPHRALLAAGFKGVIYHTHGVAHRAFLAACGLECEGVFLPAGPVLVAETLPNSHPSKPVALAYVRAYETAYGPDSFSPFGAHLWDAALLFQAALPAALKEAEPGTPAFRTALRDALENLRDVAGTHGIFTFSPTDHSGLDQRAQLMLQVREGRFVPAP